MSRSNNNFIMVVDDDLDTLLLLRSMLSSKYPSRLILTAQNGNECLEMIEASDFSYPSIVITDFQMPFMNGVELRDKLKEKYPGLKIVLSTATPVAMNGFDAVLLKPMNIDDLFSCIDTMSKS